jgi:hypothetical protein
MFQNISKYFKISHTNSRHFKIFQGIFLGQVFYSIMNVQRMKDGCSWLNSIHYDVVGDVGSDVVGDVGSDVGDDVGDGIHDSHNFTTLI